MIRRPPQSIRPYTLVPYKALFRSPRAPTVHAQNILSRTRDKTDDYIANAARCPSMTAAFERLGDKASPMRNFSKQLPCKVFHNSSTGSCCRSEEHTSELQSLMRTSYAASCLKRTNHTIKTQY